MVHRKKQSAAIAKPVAGTVLRPVLVVAGPTASGKSAAALAIAGAFSGAVVNADSMQVYRDLRILSARPTAGETRTVPHFLFGVLDARERCSVGRWLALATAAVEHIHEAGMLPVVAGGTGLYLKALMDGIAPVPPIAEAVRAGARTRLARVGPAAFHAELAARDPEAGRRILRGDPQRLLRAWEVLEETGRSLYDWQRRRPIEGGYDPGRFRFLPILLMPERAALYPACDARFGAMVDAGAVAEVAALRARRLDSDLPAVKAVGVPEIGRYLAGDWDRATMIDQGRQATRRYAKRQYTWFGKQMESIYRVNEQFSERVLDEIFTKIHDFLLTPPA
jgi:tRNA dimethylallyltransferase